MTNAAACAPTRRCLVVALLLLLPISGGCASDSPDAAVLASSIKAKLTLPARVDDDTRLDDIRAVAKKELGYFLTLTKKASALDPGFPKRLEAQLRGIACRNPDYATLFKAGISLRLTYQSADQAELARIVLVPKDCGFGP